MARVVSASGVRWHGWALMFLCSDLDVQVALKQTALANQSGWTTFRLLSGFPA